MPRGKSSGNGGANGEQTKILRHIWEEMKGLRVEFKTELVATRAEFKTELAETRDQLGRRIEETNSRLDQVHRAMTDGDVRVATLVTALAGDVQGLSAAFRQARPSSLDEAIAKLEKQMLSMRAEIEQLKSERSH